MSQLQNPVSKGCISRLNVGCPDIFQLQKTKGLSVFTQRQPGLMTSRYLHRSQCYTQTIMARKKRTEEILDYTVILEPAEEGGYVVSVPALEGCFAHERNRR